MALKAEVIDDQHAPQLELPTFHKSSYILTPVSLARWLPFLHLTSTATLSTSPNRCQCQTLHQPVITWRTTCVDFEPTARPALKIEWTRRSGLNTPFSEHSGRSLENEYDLLHPCGFSYDLRSLTPTSTAFTPIRLALTKTASAGSLMAVERHRFDEVFP